DLGVTLLEDLAIPDEIGRHVRAARSARDQLEAAVDDAHLPRRIARLAAVVPCLQLPNLPRAVHLAAQAPVAHVVPLRVPVRAPSVRKPSRDASAEPGS